MPAGKLKASSGWTSLPEAPLIGYADPSFPSRVREVIRRIEQQLDYVRGTISGDPEFGDQITATLPLALSATDVLSIGGLSTIGTGNRFVGVNGAGTTWEYKVIVGVINRVNLAHTAGQLELSLPQDIHNGATPTFADMTLSGLTASKLMASNGSKKLVSVADLTAWVAGVANRVIVTDDLDGTITLSLPQDIHAAATPTFAGLTLSGLTASRLMASDGAKALVSVADLTAWIAGVANRVTVANDGDGTITLSLPQDIHTAATPQFGGLTISGGQATFSSAAAAYASIRIGGMSGSPTSPAAGDVWIDTTYNTIVERLSGKNTYRSGVLMSLLGTGTVSNIASETSLISGVSAAGTVVLPANFLTAGKTLRFYFAGLFDTKAAPVGTLTLRLESTNHASYITFGPFTPVASITDGGWELAALITCRTAGAGGTVGTVATLEFRDGVINRTVFVGSSAWDTTAAETFDLTAQWATADVSNTIDVYVGTLEVLF